MANAYQLVAWTEKGRVRMIPSQISACLCEEQAAIDALRARIGYGTSHEIRDILEVSSACERLGHRLLQLGAVEAAFLQYVDAARSCLHCSERLWYETDDGFETLCAPLRGRFFALFLECKELARQHAGLEYAWTSSGLQASANYLSRRAA